MPIRIDGRPRIYDALQREMSMLKPYWYDVLVRWSEGDTLRMIARDYQRSAEAIRLAINRAIIALRKPEHSRVILRAIEDAYEERVHSEEPPLYVWREIASRKFCDLCGVEYRARGNETYCPVCLDGKRSRGFGPHGLRIIPYHRRKRARKTK